MHTNSAAPSWGLCGRDHVFVDGRVDMATMGERFPRDLFWDRRLYHHR